MIELDQHTDVLDIQCSKDHITILYVNGRVHKINSYSSFDNICQYLHMLANYSMQDLIRHDL